MTTDSRTPDQIERDIEAERAQMSGTINDLQKKFSVEGIMGDFSHMIREQGGDLGRAINRTVGGNPAAVVLVSVGLAWLLIGNSRDTGQGVARASGRRQVSRHHHRAGPDDQWDSTWKHRAADEDFSYTPESDRFWYDDIEEASSTGDDDRAQGNWPQQARHDQAASGVKGAIRSGVDAVKDAVTGAVGNLGETATSLKDKLMHGTDDLSDEAKERILTLRQAAHDARLTTEAAFHRSRRVAATLFEDQPLVVGALAVAVGAAIGGALPHSRIEDETMGASRDNLMTEAQKTFEAAQKAFAEERDKVKSALGMASNNTGASRSAM